MTTIGQRLGVTPDQTKLTSTQLARFALEPGFSEEALARSKAAAARPNGVVTDPRMAFYSDESMTHIFREMVQTRKVVYKGAALAAGGTLGAVALRNSKIGLGVSATCAIAGALAVKIGGDVLRADARFAERFLNHKLIEEKHRAPKSKL